MTIVKYFKPNRYSCNGNEQPDTGIETWQDLFFGSQMGNPTVRTPEANIYESAADFRIEIALPGIRKSNVKISIDKEVLSVTINQEDNTEGRMTVKEYDFTTGKRSFILPDSINTDEISSRLENGILTIGLPKKESALPKGQRDIQIN